MGVRPDDLRFYVGARCPEIMTPACPGDAHEQRHFCAGAFFLRGPRIGRTVRFAECATLDELQRAMFPDGGDLEAGKAIEYGGHSGHSPETVGGG
jgi:hypothetical protein